MWWCTSIRPGMAGTDGEMAWAMSLLPGRSAAPAPAAASAWRNFLREAPASNCFADTPPQLRVAFKSSNLRFAIPSPQPAELSRATLRRNIARWSQKGHTLQVLLQIEGRACSLERGSEIKAERDRHPRVRQE